MKTGIFTMKRVLAFTIAVVASMTMLAGGTQPVMTAQNASRRRCRFYRRRTVRRLSEHNIR